MANENIEQVFVANPATSMQPDDLFYLGRSPYGITNDMAILWSNVLASISAQIQGGITWVVVTTATQQMAANTGYIINDPSSLVTLTLPVTFNPGDVIRVIGFSADGWTIAQNAGQEIHFGTDNVTPGSGTLSSSQLHDSVELIGTVANTDFVVADSMGNLATT